MPTMGSMVSVFRLLVVAERQLTPSCRRRADLFSGLGDLEEAAFGSSSKARASLDYLESPSDCSRTQDYGKLASKGDDSGSDENSGDDSDEQSDEYGIDDYELIDPSDDDDHAEMYEMGSDDEGDGGMEMTFGGDDDFGLGDDDESDDGEELSDLQGESESGDEEAPTSDRKVRFAADDAEPPATAPTPAPAPAAGRYVPPHLRAAAASATAATPTPPSAPEAPTIDPRLRRQINGHLNKLSSSNMPAILAALEALYATNPRAIVSATLTSLLVDNISGRDNLGELLVITYAALVAAVSRSVGIEFPAGVIAKTVMTFDDAREKNEKARSAGGEEDGDRKSVV